MRAIFFILIILNGVAGSAQRYSVADISADVKEGAKAVIRLNEKTITLKSYNQMHVEQTLVVTVFAPEGDQYAVMPIFYNPQVKILDMGGEVLDEYGNNIKVFKKKDFQDVSAVNGSTLYADDRIIFANYNPTKYPYTVKHTYSYQTSNTAFIPNWQPIFAYEAGIEKDIYNFKNESGLEVFQLPLNFDDFEDYITFNSSGESFSYTLENFSPIKYEVLSPGLEEITPSVLITTHEFELAGFGGKYSNWNDFGKWMYNDLIHGRQQLPADEKARITEMLSGISDTREKVRILYQYMQNKTRYINVAIGIGGWQPYPAEYVSTKGYGDCKALSNYMMSLLAEAKIPSNYTVVYGDPLSNRSIRADFAAMQGNHVILQVPLENDTVWLECTSQLTAFNHLGKFTGNREALIVGPEGGKIVRTQNYPPEKNKEIIKGIGKIDENGDLQLNFKVENTGIQYDDTYYVAQETKLDQKNWLMERYNAIRTKTIDSFEFENDKNNAVFLQNISITAPSFAQISGNNFIFPIVPLGHFETSLSKDSSRKHPLQLNHGYADESEFILEIPIGYKLNYVPEPIHIDSEFGNYHLDYKLTDNQLLVKRKITTNSGLFPKESYMDYVEFRRAIEKADNTKILLEK